MVHKILFVCMGNICRSPTAEAVFQKKVNEKQLQDFFHLDSAGTHNYHLGASPDKRSQQAALKREVTMGHLRARQVTEEDRNRFDYIVAMDHNNVTDLQRIFSGKSSEKIMLMMSFAGDSSYQEVPDPYYGETDGFELVLDLLEQASDGLLSFIQAKQARD